MAFNPLKEKGLPLEKQVRNWWELAGKPYQKDEVDPYTRCRIILMNGIEVEAAIFLHEFNRNEKRPEVKERLAMQRRIEQQQQKAVSGLIPGDESILENTIGYEQVAVDLTAFLARTVTDPYVKQVFDFGLLEDFDHLYRYSNLMETLEGKQAQKIVRDYTEIIPGRPTMFEHRHPFDSLKRPSDRKKADPKDLLYILTLTAGEQQTMNFYMNMANRLTDQVGRGLYIEIGMIEEQHVTQYESLLDPRMSWFEMMVCHEYNECYLYHSFMEKEVDPRIRKIWELNLDIELGHLRAASEMLKKYEKKDAQDILPKALPAPIVFEPNIDYVRDVLESQINLTEVGTSLKPVDEVDPGYRYFQYQDMVNSGWIPSEEVIEEHMAKFKKDYRQELTDGQRAGKVQLAEYYRQKAPTKDIFTLLHKDHDEVRLLFEKIKSGSAAREALFSELSEELSMHMEGEEHLFYPKLKESAETHDLTMEGYEEHEEAKGILGEMEKMTFGNKEWLSKLNDLQKSVEHHVEEEEKQLFEKARSIIDQEHSQTMAKEFQTEKQENMKKTG
jgi:hypothetical protein